jgi:hypothetical protein
MKAHVQVITNSSTANIMRQTYAPTTKAYRESMGSEMEGGGGEQVTGADAGRV